MRARRLGSALVVLALASCGKKDNSADTDQVGRDLTKAQSELTAKGRDVATNEGDVERRKRELAAEQQALADKEKALAADRQELGSARETFVQARAAYSAGVSSRFAKLDAAIAGLATKTSAASKDAVVGLRARRELLSAKLASMPAVTDEQWTAYAKDVDTVFDAIERDVHAAAD
jgi:chromosome segregation ATPase